MTAASTSTCATTGLYLVQAGREDTYRIARTSYGPLNVLPREATGAGRVVVTEDGTRSVLPWDEMPNWNRWDTIGRTLYVADSTRGAYAEILQDFKEPLDVTGVAQLAEAMDMTPTQYLTTLDAQWVHLGAMPRGSVPASWREARAMYTVRLPGAGWWVDVEHGDTLTALEAGAGALTRILGGASTFTRADVLGEDRRLTTTIAGHVRAMTLFDGSQPLGITWQSKTGYGRNWAYWMRRADDDVSAGSNDPAQRGPGVDIKVNDADLRHVADRYGLKVF